MYVTLKKSQPNVLRILENSLKNNRLSHAYLFTGPNGTYKKETAYHLAMMLYCKENVPCYKCSECMAILENRHMNVYYIEPFGQTIKKEQIMALQEEFSKTSLVAGPRIYIINEAHTMSSSAANSLLKFIEEPTSETYGILITEHKENMLSTIVSRSVVVSFDELDKGVLKEQLAQNELSPLVMNSLCYLTSNIVEAQELIADEGFVKVCEIFNKFIVDLNERKGITLYYKTYSDVFSNKDKLNMFLRLLEAYFRDVYEYQVLNKVLIFDSLEDEIKNASTLFDSDDILNYLFQLLELTKKIGYNVNISLLINQFLIDLNGGI